MSQTERFYPGDPSAVEESINSRHLEDYEEGLATAPLEKVLSAGLGCIVLIRERLTIAGELRPFNFRFSASEYRLEPNLWPVVLTFSRYRGARDDFGPHIKLTGEPGSNDPSLVFYARL